MKTSQKGFTLIELLVVISIISLLSSIVLAALKDARMKAVDAAIISDLSQMRVTAQLYVDLLGYDTHNGFCEEWVNDLREDLDERNGNGSEYCFSDGPWVEAVELTSRDAFFCVDNNGTSKFVPGDLGPSPIFTACP